MVIWVKIFKTEKTIEIQLVRLTEVCGKVLSEKNAYKSVKQHCDCPMLLFTNKGHFSSPSWVLIGVLAQFYE